MTATLRSGARRAGSGARRGGTVVAALALATSMLVAARPLTAADPPLPTPAGLVSDFAGVLDTATARSITARLEELRAKTGAEIAVVTVDTTAPETAFDYAMRLAEAWKPGAPGKDNGVVFLIAVQDRELFIATGYGIEGALPDGLVGEIRDREVVPRFRAGDVPGGIRAGVERMAATIAREYGVELSGAPPPAARRTGPPASIGPLALLLLLVVLFVVLPAILSSAMPRGRRRGLFGGPVWGGGPMWGGRFGGGGFGGPGGGFGGFGGGGFGGGGAGGKW